MLVVERKKGEGVYITIPPCDKAREILVFTNKGSRADKVRLCVRAEQDVTIHRCDNKGQKVGDE